MSEIYTEAPLKNYACQETKDATPIAAKEESLTKEEQKHVEELAGNIVGKIGMDLSLNNIVSDVRGFALRPKIMRAAINLLYAKNKKEKFLSSCQLDALAAALRQTIKEEKENIPPVYKNPASLLVNQNGYLAQTPFSVLLVLPQIERRDQAVTVSDFKLVVKDEQERTVYIFDSRRSGKPLEVQYKNLKGHNKGFVSLSLPSLNEGKYKVSIFSRGTKRAGQTLEVKPLLYSEALTYAKHFFRVQRSHDPKKTYHGGVYADDPVNVGGHLDAGDNNTYLYTEAPAMLALAYASQNNGDRAFLEEAEYGARFLAGLVKKDGSMWSAIFNGYPPVPPAYETDGIKGNADDRPLIDKIWGPTEWAEATAAAVFAKCALNKIGEHQVYLEKAKLVGERLMGKYAKNIQEGDLGNNLQGFGALISYNLSLYKATKDDQYLKRIEKLTAQILKVQTSQGYFASKGKAAFQDYVPHLFIESLNELHQFYLENGKTDQANAIKESILKFASHLSKTTDPVYGRIQFLLNNSAGGVFTSASVPLQPWMTGTHRGANSYILSAANVFAIAYQLSGNEKYLQAAQKQMDWVFGINPFGISMMTGIGTSAKYYHARLQNDPVYQVKCPKHAEGGGVLGGIVNGIGERWGIPHFDLNPYPDEPPSWQTTEVWIPHVAWFALAASRLNSTR